MRLLGKTVVITGALGGIGRATTEAFIREGATVLATDLGPPDHAQEAFSQIAPEGAPPRYWSADLRDSGQIAAVSSEMCESHVIDVLINMAGVCFEETAVETSDEDWDRVHGINLRGAFLMTRALIPNMIAGGGGRIINVASQLGQTGARDMAAYCASKAGVIGLTRALARELAPQNILVNAVAPGPIETPQLWADSAEWRAQKLAELPMGRFGQPTEVAPTLIFLASEDCSYYTGQTLGPNGGDVMP